jgi:hypothetical protein
MRNLVLALSCGLLVAGCDSSSKSPDAAVGPHVDANPLDPDADLTAPDADPAAPDADTSAPDAMPQGAPTWSNEMTSAGGSDFDVRSSSGGSVTRNLADPDATDGYVARLVLPGNPALGTADHVSPDFASEQGTKAGTFSYGTYRMRVKLASCAPGEEVVNGLFTYFNDGTDHDHDGIIDNSEIDIEILCGTPDVAFLTVWTDYDGTTDTFRKLTRAIDFATGDLWDSPNDHEYGLDKTGNDPALHLPTFLDSDHFVELGFQWSATGVRYFATINGQEKTIWDMHDAAHVPTLPGAVMFNVWHPGEHWFGNAGPPDYPAHDATLTIDWVKYWQE